MVSCSEPKPDTKVHYINEHFIIRQSNESQGTTPDKFHKPMSVGIWLIESVEHPGNFTHMNTYNYGPLQISNSMWYSHGIGDTLHFDYIRKDRFFKIEKNK
jgi:hypothetical protein